MEGCVNEAHQKAAYTRKLIENPILFLTDIDGTATSGDLNPTEKELSDRSNIRKFTESKGMVEGVVTARAPCLLQDSINFEQSRLRGCIDGEPRWGMDPQTGKRIYVPLEKLRYFTGSINWDVHLCYGSRIEIKNGRGYIPDLEYDNLLRYDHVPAPAPNPKSLYEKFNAVVDEPLPWRLAALEGLRQVCPNIRDYMAELEFVENYHDGVTDVEPLPYRIQLMFCGREGLRALQALKRGLSEQRHKKNRLALRLHLSDESKVGQTEDETVYQMYVVPWFGRKEWMVKWFLSQASLASGVPRQALRLITADDQITGLKMLLYASGDIPTTSLLPTHSPVARSIIEQRTQHGHVSLTRILGRPLGPGNGYERLRPAVVNRVVQKGVYYFKVATRMKYQSTVVIGDERYPELTAPGSLHAFAEEFY